MVGVAAIDPKALQRALDLAAMTPTQLVEALHQRGARISLSYACRIIAGGARLKRNPVLRRQIAEVLNVPTHWIEAERPDPEAVVA